MGCGNTRPLQPSRSEIRVISDCGISPEELGEWKDKYGIDSGQSRIVLDSFSSWKNDSKITREKFVEVTKSLS